MRFLLRALLGLALFAIVIGLLVGSGVVLISSLKDKDSSGSRRGGDKERSYAVNVRTLVSGTAQPVTQVYGEVVSGRTLELRASSAGAIVELSPNFQEGRSIEAGDLLFQTDPANQLANRALMEAELAEASAELADANASLALAKDEVVAAQRQHSLRQQSVERQTSLKSRGVGSDSAIENAELSLSSAEQAVLTKRLALNQAQARLSRAEISQQRIQINLDEAVRKLEETTVTAKFPGVLTEVNAVLGGLVNANERLGRLIDPNALEISFRVSNRAFSQLLSNEAGLDAAKIDVVFGGATVANDLTIDRVGAAVAEGQTGRELFSQLRRRDLDRLRPGDFVSIHIKEAILENVVTIPSTAVSSDNALLIVDEDSRLTSHKVRVLRWQKDELIVDGEGLEGKNLVLERAPQLGTGIKVEVRQTNGPLFKEKKFVELSDLEKDEIRAALEKNNRIPKAGKTKILKRLEAKTIPENVAQRLRKMVKRTSSGGNPATDPDSGELIEVSESEREQLKSFISANAFIPEDRKSFILEQLSQPKVPSKIVERIRSRMAEG